MRDAPDARHFLGVMSDGNLGPGYRRGAIKAEFWRTPDLTAVTMVNSASDERYCCDVVVTFHCGADSYLAFAPSRGVARLLPSAAADVLRRCDTFRTPEGHARELIVRGPRRATEAVGVGDLAGQIRTLANAGLLVPHSELVERLLSSGESTLPGDRVRSIGVITCCRPAALRRCLTSLGENVARHGKRIEFVVVDDSQDPGMEAANRAIAAGIGKRYGIRVFHCGVKEKERYASVLLSRREFPPGVVRFGLLPGRAGSSYGANRNWLLLDTLGELTVSVDDDMVCRVGVKGEPVEHLMLLPASAPAEMYFYPSRREVFRDVAFINGDFVAVQEALLGKTLEECARSFGRMRVDVGRCTARLSSALRHGGGVVLLTSLGVAGDSGMSSPHWYLFLQGASRRRLTASEEAYRSACRSREVFRAVAAPTITDGGSWMGGCMGMDNRRLLAPFLPYCRGEDGVFMATALACDDRAFVGHLPAAMLHLPPAGRGYSPDDMSRGLGRLRLCDLVTGLITAFGRSGGCPDVPGRMHDLGVRLAELGSLDQRAFGEIARVESLRLYEAYVSSLERQLADRDGAPSFWVEDIEAQLRTCRECIVSELFPAVTDLAPSRLGALEDVSHFVRDFGLLLQYWPELRDVARNLKDDRCRPAEPVT